MAATYTGTRLCWHDAGCVFAEMLTGRPLWPGKSDIDQLDHIIRTMGRLTPRHIHIFNNNSYFHNLQIPKPQPEKMVLARTRDRSACWLLLLPFALTPKP